MNFINFSMFFAIFLSFNFASAMKDEDHFGQNLSNCLSVSSDDKISKNDYLQEIKQHFKKWVKPRETRAKRNEPKVQTIAKSDIDENSQLMGEDIVKQEQAFCGAWVEYLQETLDALYLVVEFNDHEIISINNKNNNDDSSFEEVSKDFLGEVSTQLLSKDFCRSICGLLKKQMVPEKLDLLCQTQALKNLIIYALRSQESDIVAGNIFFLFLTLLSLQGIEVNSLQSEIMPIVQNNNRAGIFKLWG
jgi:hypothetical protein